eukprot:CAMPEP_0201552876 /NCGR_PEP_ID=MMETSP0173_2-20130828/18944_1 /ASSEMBLY_ACC=CAM_ASM_000268 /TAXON_ID=218659 /ORGANISM="Vexillifera sp., Strain DIVA3 564/2" /LENGTH=195 /DNA_ID=CAMNT_0047963451 /DNA_START=93 /DNA_END=680 /DNA_ORIENTATION=+
MDSRIKFVYHGDGNVDLSIDRPKTFQGSTSFEPFFMNTETGSTFRNAPEILSHGSSCGEKGPYRDPIQCTIPDIDTYDSNEFVFSVVVKDSSSNTIAYPPIGVKLPNHDESGSWMYAVIAGTILVLVGIGIGAWVLITRYLTKVASDNEFHPSDFGVLSSIQGNEEESRYNRLSERDTGDQTHQSFFDDDSDQSV